MKYIKNILQIAMFGILLFATGCLRPVNVPEFVEVKNNETAFVIPLEGSVEGQVKLDSEKYLESAKVSQKRIPITKRWVDKGRFEFLNEGEYVYTMRVLIVDRSPITRQWEAKEGENPKQSLAIWLESGDSIGFSTGFSVSAYIEESDTARFLYSYKSTALSQVLDTELRARIQAVASEVSARFPLDALRSKKNELMDEVKKDVTPFFKAKGITITTIGMFGGFTYENIAIQESIDKTFIAQQEKVVAAAQLEAQTD